MDADRSMVFLITGASRRRRSPRLLLAFRGHGLQIGPVLHHSTAFTETITAFPGFILLPLFFKARSRSFRTRSRVTITNTLTVFLYPDHGFSRFILHPFAFIL